MSNDRKVRPVFLVIGMTVGLLCGVAINKILLSYSLQYNHVFCVPIGNDKELCSVTAQFSNLKLCQEWESLERQGNEDLYSPDKIRTYCKKDSP